MKTTLILLTLFIACNLMSTEKVKIDTSMVRAMQKSRMQIDSVAMLTAKVDSLSLELLIVKNERNFYRQYYTVRESRFTKIVEPK